MVMQIKYKMDWYSKGYDTCNIDDMISMIKGTRYSNKMVLEYFDEEVVEVKPYFDIDISNKNVDDFAELYNHKNEILNKSLEYLHSVFEIENEDFAISESKYDNKISFHVVINKKIKRDMLTLLKKQESLNFKKYCFDLAPYGKTQKFRMVKTSKDGKNSPLNPITHKTDLAKHIISYVENIDYVKFKIKLEDTTKKSKNNIIKPNNIICAEDITTNHHDNITIHNQDSMVQKLVNTLSGSRADDYDEWLNVGICLYNISVDNEHIWTNFSKKSEKYKDGECKKKWMTFQNNKYTIGSLYYWSKCDNPEEYEKIINSHNMRKIMNALNCTDADIAEISADILRDEWVYSNKSWYYFDGVRWIKDISNDRIFISFSRVVQAFKRYKAYAQLDDSVSDSVKENTQGLIDEVINKHLKSKRGIDNVLVFVKNLLRNDKFHAQLDSNIFLIGFNDGVFDLMNNVFRKSLPEDLISKNCGWNYSDVTKISNDDINDFNDVFNKIFVDKEQQEYIIDLYSACLNGHSPQMFQINSGFNNSGGNGKGLLKRWMLKAIGEYASEFNVSLLTQKRGKANAANAELSKLVSIRFAICSEPEHTAQINGAIIKEMTGGDTLSCRQLYSNDDSFKPSFTLFMECNKKPAVDVEDGGIMRRFRVCEFKSCFVEDITKIDANKNIYEMDDTLYLAENIDRYGLIWLSILIKNHNTLIKTKNHLTVTCPEFIKQNTYQYFNDTNLFINWMNNTLVESEKNDSLSMQELYSAYKNSDEYINQPKRSRMTKKECETALIKSPYYKYYHHISNKNLQLKHPISKNSNTIGYHHLDLLNVFDL
jgi:P4 family phage/plasmid primase-like protien